MVVLKKIFPLLAEEIAKAEDVDGKLKIETASSGLPTLAVAGVYVHSKRDPEREAQRLVDAAFANGQADEIPALVLGFGLGYTATALADRFQAKPLIVVEKRVDILKKALEVRDLTALLSRPHVVFVLDSEGVTGALSLFKSSPHTPPLVFTNRPLTGLDSEWYAAVEDKIRTWVSRTNINRATQKRFGERWVRNLSSNLEASKDIPGITKLEGLLAKSNIPVFLAAAGPSLDDAAPILRDIYSRCLVVAVDTSLRFLLARGIEPDFLLSVDPQYWNFRHLDRQKASKTRLVAESAVYPSVLRGAFGGIFLCSSFFPLGRFIEDRTESKGTLGAGGSVATSAWDFARFLGAKTAWLSGLDLSFPELKTHFHGALFEEKSHAESGRFVPAETWNFRALRDGHHFLAKSIGGGEVLTDKRLSIYAAWFESRFSQFPEIRNYSFSLNGLAIKGIEAASVEEFMALPERRLEIDNILSKSDVAIENDFFHKETAKLRDEKYKTAFASLLNGLDDVKNLSEDAAEYAKTAATKHKMGHLKDTDRETALKKLDRANKSIAESAVKEVTAFLFPDTEGWEEEIAAGTPEALARHLEFLSRFHNALWQAAKNNLRVLSKVKF